MKVRLETMSKKHCIIFTAVVSLALVILFFSSLRDQNMFNIKEGVFVECGSPLKSEACLFIEEERAGGDRNRTRRYLQSDGSSEGSNMTRESNETES